MKRRLLSVFLAAVMAVTAFAVPTFAAGYGDLGGAQEDKDTQASIAAVLEMLVPTAGDGELQSVVEEATLKVIPYLFSSPVAPSATELWNLIQSIANNPPADPDEAIRELRRLMEKLDKEHYVTVVVTGGTGSTGSGWYQEGQRVDIYAGTPANPVTMKFDRWTSSPDVIIFDDPTAESTYFIMPERPAGENIRVIGAFVVYKYWVDVQGGRESGYYEVGKPVDIHADSPPPRMRFDHWSSEDGVVFDDATSADTFFTMLAKNVVVTANYVIFEYPVNVIRGTAEKDYYQEGEEVRIVADDISGKRFNHWIADGVTIDFPNSASTSFIMPANAVTVIAEYVDVFPVTVINGVIDDNGGNERASGDIVPIRANPAEPKMRFDHWSSEDGVVFADATSESTTFTMLAKAVTVEAIYVPITYRVDVINGSGSGYYEEDATVDISAYVIPGKRFDYWTSDGVTLDDPTLASTSFSMPANAVTVEARYVDVFPVTVIDGVIVGDGGNEFAAGEPVEISANPPQPKWKFDHWSSDDGVVFADATSEDTTFTMLARAVTVEAIFVPITYPVTVINGAINDDGGNERAEGDIVHIAAIPTPAGKRFTGWTSEDEGVIFADPDSPRTSFTMPANAVTVKANFVDVYLVTVIYGAINDGHGNERTAGETVHIIAGGPPQPGDEFDEWISDPSVIFTYVDEESSSEASFVMPASAITVTATFFTPADKTRLIRLIDKVNWMFDNKKFDTYTASSVAVLEEALADAEVVRDYRKATQQEVDNAYDRLLKALCDLLNNPDPDPVVFTCPVKSMLAKVGKLQQIPYEWNGYGKLTFTSSQPDVCGVTQDGILIPMKIGIAVITITQPSGAKYMFAVSVSV